MREHLEICWPFTKEKRQNSAFSSRGWENMNHSPSAGLCRHTSLFVQQRLKEHGFGKWTCAGGTGRIDGGEEFGGHWWLERDGTILDLTADQFSGPPIQICPVNHPDYRKDERMSRQVLIAGLRGVSDQWQGRGFGFYDHPDDTERIRASYCRLEEKLEQISPRMHHPPESKLLKGMAALREPVIVPKPIGMVRGVEVG